MPRNVVIFEFDEEPGQYTVGKSMVDLILWRGRLYDRDWSDDDTPDDSKSAKPACIVTEDGQRFKPAARQSLADIAALYRSAGGQEGSG